MIPRLVDAIALTRNNARTIFLNDVSFLLMFRSFSKPYWFDIFINQRHECVHYKNGELNSFRVCPENPYKNSNNADTNSVNPHAPDSHRGSDIISCHKDCAEQKPA